MLKPLFVLLCMLVTTNLFAIDGGLLKTIDYSFQDKWEYTTGGSAPIFSTPKQLFKGQNLFITVIITDFDVNKKGKANVKYSVKIIKPDNSVYFFQENVPILEDKTIVGKYFHMSNSILKISFDEKDMFGKYKIEANVTDINVDKSVLFTSDIELKILPKYEIQNTDDEKFSKWLSEYHRRPTPEEALSYYLHFFQTLEAKDESENEDNGKRMVIITIFFTEIFKNNHFLLPQIKDIFQKKDGKDKKPLILLLKSSGINEKLFLDLFDAQEKESYSKLQGLGDVDMYMYGEISDAIQLDMLWSVFLASGSYKPILKLVQTLDYVKYEGEIEKYKKSKTQTEAEREKAVKASVFISLTWSLESNAEQHKLVKDFLNWALKNDKLNAVQKEELEKILKK